MSNTGWSAGTETEADLPFAGLHRLLRPVLSGADELPRRQREAILAAFGLSDGSASDLFLVGLAALTLVADPAAQSPLLLLVPIESKATGSFCWRSRGTAPAPTSRRSGWKSFASAGSVTRMHRRCLPSALPT